jgi:hypothetical protein
VRSNAGDNEKADESPARFSDLTRAEVCRSRVATSEA